MGARRAGGVIAAVMTLFVAMLLPAQVARAEPRDATPAAVDAGSNNRAGRAAAAAALKHLVPEIDHRHLFVRYRSRPSDLGSRLARAGAREERAVAGTGWTTLATTDAVAVRNRLRRDSAVARTAFSYVRHIATVPNDPRYASAQVDYLDDLRMDRTWDIEKGSGVTVAVLDTGADSQHPDLTGRLFPGHNETPSFNSVQDDNGHGTMVAGIIAANIDNHRGIAGIAPQAKILPVKVMNAFGSGDDADIAAGITYAATNATHPADVINLSLSGVGDGTVMCAAIATALAHDVVVVAAAGNSGSDTPEFPAACPGVISVGATNHSNAITSFSNYGWAVDIAAPGLDITSTALDDPPSRDSYAKESGTSFSSPIVAGVAALVRGRSPGLTQSQVVTQLLTTARDRGYPGVDRAFGHGVVDPRAALGLPPLAPRPVIAAPADDTSADATLITEGVTQHGDISPETDEDWYGITLAAGWHRVRVPFVSSGFEDTMDPVIALYDITDNLLASQEFTGGDLEFNIAAPGNYFIRVRNRGANVASYSMTVSPISQPALFGTPLDLDVESASQSVAIGDVTGDGLNDIAFLMGHNSDFNDALIVLAQTADRSFRLAGAIDTPGVSGPGSTPGGGLVIADVIGDTKPDVAFPTSQGIEVIPQGSDGLDADSAFTLNDAGVKQLAVGDVDQDGDPDVVAVGTQGLQVFWGATAPAQQVAPDSSASVAVGDISGDGHPDLVTVRSGQVAAFARTAPRTFGAAMTFDILSATNVPSASNVAIDAGDIVATGRTTPGSFTVLHDNAGVLQDTIFMGVAAKPEPIVVSNVDSNSAGNEILTLHDTTGLLGVAPRGGGSETLFAADDSPAARYDARALAVGDLDNDGSPDAIVATSFGIGLLMHRLDTLPTNYGNRLVTDVTPAPTTASVASNVTPHVTVSFAATNATTTVKLFDSSGDNVPATITGNGTTTLTITPNSALADGAYTIRIDGLHDAGGDELNEFESSFVVGAAPDESAPSLSFTNPPSGTRDTAHTTIKFSSSDGTATFFCSRDNSVFRSCTSPVTFDASAGHHNFAVIARDPAGNERRGSVAWTYRPRPKGYWMLGGAGAVYHFGTVPSLGSAHASFATDIEPSASGYGYWVVDAVGHVFAFGDAKSYGNAGTLLPGEIVTSISRTASGQGYWLFTSRGRVFARGNATSFGDLHNKVLNGPVLDSVRSAGGHGYFMVGSDGGVFAFGDAHFVGSTGGRVLPAPIRTLVPDPDGTGYWLTGRDGSVYPFRAASHGSMAGKVLNKPVVGMVAFGNGYLMVASDGGIFNFSNKPFYGSLGAHPPAIPIVAVASFA
jgi:type VII secretion-associated serine protease mycosin